MIQRTSLDRTVIEHRELLAPISGTILFTPNAFPVNPGLVTTFPWLSTQAVGWEKYRFEYIRFCYYTRAPTSTQGSVLLSPDYNAADAPPATEVISSAYNGTQEDAPWKDICCPLDAKIVSRECFVRGAALAPNLDIKTYDIATFYLGTVDATTAAPWGKLWVEYKVHLINPQLPSAGAGTTGTMTNGASATGTALFGTSQTSTGSFVLSAAGNVITMGGLSIGLEYEVSVITNGTGITAYSTSGSITNSVVKSPLATGPGLAGTFGVAIITFTPTATTCALTMAAATLTTITLSTLTLTLLNPPPAF
jgi:hypothetical protein